LLFISTCFDVSRCTPSHFFVSLLQGDGTSFIFKDNENVFTFDMHCGKNFPFRKQKSDLDIPLEENLEDEDYLNVLQVLLALLVLFTFNLVNLLALKKIKILIETIKQYFH
jgi:hypothetical protein